ncbi:MAG: phage tail tape measure protein [Pseudomonadota bacterium]
MEFETRGLTSALEEIRGSTADVRAELAAATTAMRGMDREAQTLARSLGSSLRSALDKAIFGGAKLGDVFRGLASDVLGKSLDLALKPLQGTLSSGIGSALGSLTGGLGGLFGFAKGGVLDQGKIRAFAKGGVVDRATLFPMKGATGLMGEAGPEAIMPLTRGPDGKLGVASSGSSGGGPVVNITIQTPDAESFRRSRGQIGAELARAVGRGNRRL